MKYISLLVLVSTYVASTIGDREEPEFKINVDKDIQIELYTLKNPNSPQILVVDDKETIAKSHYNPKKPTRILIHGFGNGAVFTRALVDGYLVEAGHDLNVIAINWSKASNTINYPYAKKTVPIIGQYTAKFIDFMVKNKLTKLSNLVVIGFSLGAHAAGFTGKYLESGRLPKLIGLDPASILYSINKPEERLNATDAIYVETIQTSRLGFINPIGSVSFYPNGGRNQPGCQGEITGACSHYTVYDYFAQTIYMGSRFYGDFCESLEDIKDGKCNNKKHAAMGGEPGVRTQPAGMYFIRMVPTVYDEQKGFDNYIDQWRD